MLLTVRFLVAALPSYFPPFSVRIRHRFHPEAGSSHTTMTLNDKLPLSQTDDGPSGAGQAGAAVRAAAEKQTGGGGVLQHLEDLEDEAEPPEKKLQQQQPLGRKFTILSKIGEGGYGNVYTVKKVGESSENDSGRIYALKVGDQVLYINHKQCGALCTCAVYIYI